MVDLLVQHGAGTLSYNAHALKISALKATGLIASDASPADISPKQLKLYLAMTTRLGIDKPERYKPDPRLSNPVKTWELHKQAVIAGDFSLIQKTLTRPDHPLLEIFEMLDQEKRRELVQEMRPIERITQDDERAKFRIYRKIKNDEITFYVYFIKVFGEWKIDDY
jgi:hypothetical protein